MASLQAYHQTTVHVYVDEQGAFPLDGSEPFAVAAIAARQVIPKVPTRDPAAVLTALQDLGATLAIYYVKPFEGFADRMAAKHRKMTFMGWCTRMMTGRHDYLPQPKTTRRTLYVCDVEIPWRDAMWGVCVRQTIASAVVGLFGKGRIEHIDAVTDSKNMGRVVRRLFDDQVDMMRDSISTTAQNVFGPNQQLWDSNARVRLRLVDEPGTKNARNGLALADVVARVSWNEIRKTGNASTFLGRSRRDAVCDMTAALMEPIDRRAIESWVRRTGLPEPFPGI
jgi:hypothetical protein